MSGRKIMGALENNIIEPVRKEGTYFTGHSCEAFFDVLKYS